MESSTDYGMNSPLVSVLLSVYNGERTLVRCLNSIKQQTYQPWELIAVDDSSSVASFNILRDFIQQTSGQVITNSTRLGLTKSLTLALRQARGKYIARIDADDVWVVDKLAAQIQFLESHPEVGVVGTWYINQTGSTTKQIQLPVTHQDIRRVIYRTNPFGHSCVVMRADLLRQIGGYDEQIEHGQDYDLWLRLLPATRFHNLPEYLCTRDTQLVPNRNKQRKQMRQMVRTIISNVARNGASPIAYLGILAPLLILLTPRWIKNLRA